MSTLIVLRDEPSQRFIVGHDSMVLYCDGMCEVSTDPKLSKLAVWPHVAVAYSGDTTIPRWLGRRIGKLRTVADWRALQPEGPLEGLAHLLIMFRQLGEVYAWDNWSPTDERLRGPTNQATVGYRFPVDATTPRNEKWVLKALANNEDWGCRPPYRVKVVPWT